MVKYQNWSVCMRERMRDRERKKARERAMPVVILQFYKCSVILQVNSLSSWSRWLILQHWYLVHPTDSITQTNPHITNHTPGGPVISQTTVTHSSRTNTINPTQTHTLTPRCNTYCTWHSIHSLAFSLHHFSWQCTFWSVLIRMSVVPCPWEWCGL